MPVYEFACSKCGKKSEMLVKLGTKKEPVCDMCGKPMKRVMSAPAFILVGGGWSKDNYGLKPATKSKNGDKSNGAQGI